uniref:NADH-ubiquinone oxidoreductase chain 2 n=1 Tax=Curculionoidea sp. 1 KM-2017 TaxID=2219392 RepID=A0A346RI04_9CUCU|nr:NADH dehydrogenase subunit 2 [Curculionoidea sp. 1 KM-2017]
MYFFKLVFFNSMLMGTLISISSLSWMTAWMGLEINLLSILPLMKSKKFSYSSESTIKYFIIQTIASMMFLFTIISSLNFYPFNNNFLMQILFMICLLMKMGAAPFHFWMPEIASSLNWKILFIILTWQKLAPSIMISYINNYHSILFISIIMSAIIGSIQGLNQICLRKLMSYSSINHISWMISNLMNSNKMWFMYFIIYSISNFFIIFMFNKNKMFYLNQLMNFMINNKIMKLIFMMNFLSLSGLPPMIGFLPKWLTINYLSNNNLYLLALILIMFTLISMYFYLRITFSSFTILTMENQKYFFSTKMNKIFNFNFLFLLSMPFYTLVYSMFLY